jgi:DNA repair protein RAD16
VSQCLPPRVVRFRRVELDDEENDFYEALYGQSKTKFLGYPQIDFNSLSFLDNFVRYVDEGTILNNYAHVFDLLLRLRQAVDHPYLVLHNKG